MDRIPPKQKEPDLMEGGPGELREVIDVDVHKHMHLPKVDLEIQEEVKRKDSEEMDVGGDSDEEVKIPGMRLAYDLGIQNKISQRLRAPIYNVDELEEESDLNKRTAFGLNDIRTNIYLSCYRCKRE